MLLGSKKRKSGLKDQHSKPPKKRHQSSSGNPSTQGPEVRKINDQPKQTSINFNFLI